MPPMFGSKLKHIKEKLWVKFESNKDTLREIKKQQLILNSSGILSQQSLTISNVDIDTESVNI